MSNDLLSRPVMKLSLVALVAGLATVLVLGLNSSVANHKREARTQKGPIGPLRPSHCKERGK